MVASGDVGLAFAMVCGAGAASAVGAALCVFWVGLASPRVVASSLGFAAGVMLYVVFTEIFMKKCNGSFELAGYSESAAYRLATACFFSGIAATALLDVCVHHMMHWAAKVKQRRVASSAAVTCACGQGGSMLPGASAPAAAPAPAAPAAAAAAGTQQQWQQRQQQQQQRQLPEGDLAIELSPLMGDSTRGEGYLHGLTYKSASSCMLSVSVRDCEMGSTLSCCRPGECSSPAPCCRGRQDGCGPTARCYNTGAGEAAFEIAPGTAPAEVVSVLQGDPHTKDMLRMGIFTGLAIAIHNLPEGLATFVGALNDTKVGASIAVAIAIHNVPEGICVAMPIYYATGSKWKGFLWGSLTGLAEPVGGLLGYLAVHEQSDLSFAIVFGIVAGMMVYVSIKELLPSAFRFDPKDQVVSTSVIVGMGVMAASLLLFTL